MLSWDDFDEKEKIAEQPVSNQILEKEESQKQIVSSEKKAAP